MQGERCHFIGIGGIGMSALAKILLERGIKVSGSDLKGNYVTSSLEKLGAKIYLHHSPDNIPSAPGVVIYSSAIKQNNIEYQTAKVQGNLLWHRSELLDYLMRGYKPLLVTGTHGKTTTTSLLAMVLVNGGYMPSYAIGGVAKDSGTNSAHGIGEYFVAEADESDGSFLKYKPFGAIITNVEKEHLDHYCTEENMKEAYIQFAKSVVHPALLLWCQEDRNLRSFQLAGYSYGFSDQADLQAISIRERGWQIVFDIKFKGILYREVILNMLGRHNVLNALAVFGLALLLNIPEQVIRETLAVFKGVGRRMDKKAEINGVTLFDDYAHHPTEVLVTLNGLKQAVKDKRLIGVFQPHRYTRLRDCWSEFREAFASVDYLFMTDVYPAGEEPIEGITSEVLAEQVKLPKEKIRYVPRTELATAIYNFFQPGDIVITIGAGDVTYISKELADIQAEKDLS